MTRHLTRPLVAIPAVLLLLSAGAANAGQTIDETGVIVCVNDKWDETEPEKGHKLVDYAGRCVKVPDSATAAKSTEDCAGKYEYMPDGSWTASGTCNVKLKGGDTLAITWQEGSQLKDYTYQTTGGTEKFTGATGGGTYKYDQLTDTLFGGRYNSKWQLP